VSFFDRILGRRTASPPPMDYDRARDIVADFGEHMESRPVPLGTVRDSSELPHPKELIQAAFERLFADGVDPEWREAIKIAYLELSSWQVGVGPSSVGLDTSKLDLNADPRELARAVMAQQAAGAEFVTASTAERQKRQEELDRLSW